MTNLPFERKSKVNTNSDNYLDANGNYVYIHILSSIHDFGTTFKATSVPTEYPFSVSAL